MTTANGAHDPVGFLRGLSRSLLKAEPGTAGDANALGGVLRVLSRSIAAGTAITRDGAMVSPETGGG